MKYANELPELIGNTPLVRLGSINPNIYAKVESFNPLSSVKDRPAYYMLKAGMDGGQINEETVIVEPTSGNTGIALAYICTALKLKLVLTMPESMSQERRALLAALGAKLELTPASEGMRGAINKAKEICESQNGFMPNQFENPANAQAHRETTGPEILRDLEGGVDIFVAGVGTGGTITGCGEVLKQENPNIRVVAVEPEESPVLSGGKPAPHKIQGIGAGFIPKVLNMDILDEIVQVDGEEAARKARLLSRAEGLLCGISSGAALAAAMKLSTQHENKYKKIVVLLPDTGERYLSTGLFNEG